jgi:hypothetical protein
MMKRNLNTIYCSVPVEGAAAGAGAEEDPHGRVSLV